MLAGEFFVTPHAVRQFQKRIAPLSYNEALAVIIRGTSTVSVDRYSVTSNGVALCIRVSEPLAFRAIVNEGAGAQMAITTILRSGLTKHNRRRLARYFGEED